MLILNFIIFETLLFAAILLVLKKLLFTDANSALNRLNDTRIRTEKKQNELEERIKKFEESCRVQVADTQKKAEEIKSQAIAESDKKGREIIEKARAQAEEIVTKANDAKERLKAILEKEVELKMMDFCANLYTRAFVERMPVKFNDAMIDDFMAELPKMDAKYIADAKEMEIITISKLNEDVKNKIKSVIEGKINHKVNVKEKEDKSILAGIIVKFGTLAIDGSLKSKLVEAAEKIKVEKERK